MPRVYNQTVKRIKDYLITWGFILLIGAGLVVLFDYAGSHPSKNDCVIGRDSADCLEGSGAGHPIWNN
jgi:hypothetical protein